MKYLLSFLLSLVAFESIAESSYYIAYRDSFCNYLVLRNESDEYMFATHIKGEVFKPNRSVIAEAPDSSGYLVVNMNSEKKETIYIIKRNLTRQEAKILFRDKCGER